MASVYRLKSPLFVTFVRDGTAREEAIRYVKVETRSDPDERMIQPPVKSPDELAKLLHSFVSRIDSPLSVPELLVENGDRDIEEGLRDAYHDAQRRALDYLWGIAQRENPDAPPYRDSYGAIAVADVTSLCVGDGAGMPQ